MSAGHGHHRANPHHHTDLAKLKREPDWALLWARWQNINNQYDIPDLAGYNVAGTERYIDRDFYKALFDPEYAKQIGLHPIDTGLSPERTIVCLMEHEGDEKVILDQDNPIDLYEPAHCLATTGEHERVRQLGGSPVKYERGLKAAIKFCESKPPQHVPLDLAVAPYLDETDATDQRILKELQALGVKDAEKQSKKSTKYSSSTGKDRCDGCANWQPDPQQAKFHLARCAVVDGLVRDSHWCNKYEAGAAQVESPPLVPEQQAEPQKPAPDINALAASVAQMAEAVHALAQRPSTKRKRTITTRRDEQGNLVADVQDADDEGGAPT